MSATPGAAVSAPSSISMRGVGKTFRRAKSTTGVEALRDITLTSNPTRSYRWSAHRGAARRRCCACSTA
jgi:hypothetical protein